jgi:hypothetical protein
LQCSLEFHTIHHVGKSRQSKLREEKKGWEKKFMVQVAVGGHTVDFPFQPYPTQLMMMDKLLHALQHRKHALLECPTGTGKSLSLICAALAWQQQWTPEKDQKIKQAQQAQARTQSQAQAQVRVQAQAQVASATTTSLLSTDPDFVPLEEPAAGAGFFSDGIGGIGTQMHS